MGRHQSRLKVSCWKERDCRTCGRRYKYFFSQHRMGHGESRAEAELDAVERYVAALESQADPSPCPNCGSYQPEMIAALWFPWCCIFLFVIAAWLAVVVIVASTFGMPRWPFWLMMAAPASLLLTILGLNVFINSVYPVFKRPANRARAAKLVRQDLARVRPDDPAQPAAPAGSKPAGSWAFGLLAWLALGGLIFLPTGELVRRCNGWPANRDWTPEVAGPGDWTWCYTDRTIYSLQGHWTGSAAATLEPLDQPGVFIPADANTRTDNWGDFIEFKRGEEAKRATVWVSVQVPDDVALEGKECRVHLAANIAYPEINPNGRRDFLVREGHVQHTATIRLASRRAGTMFFLAWYAGMVLPIAPLAIFQVYCAMRAYRLKSTGSATVVVSHPKLKDADPDEPPPTPPPDTSFESTGPG